MTTIEFQQRSDAFAQQSRLEGAIDALYIVKRDIMGEEGDVPIPSAALDIAEQDMEMEIVGQTSDDNPHLMMTSQVIQVTKPHQFHPNYLWKTQYDFNYEGSPLQTHCGQLLDHTGRSSVLETGNAFSTAGNLQQSPHHWEILEDFLVWMQAQIIPIWDHWNYFPCMPQPFNSWVNLQREEEKH